MQRFGTPKYKKTLLEKCKFILNKYEINSILNDEDKIYMTTIIQNHKEAKQKIGCGIKNIRIRLSQYNNKAFYIERNDGTTTDFSYIKSLYHASPISDIKKACRTAIYQDILYYKDQLYKKKVICIICNKEISKEELHIHHNKPDFNEIFNINVASIFTRSQTQ
jgi:hypothetical protein